MKIGVVIVTFNRKKDLEKALKIYEQQTFTPEYLIVVNNKSTDGTEEFLNDWKNKNSDFKKYVINLEENIGGSGGFYTGLEKAFALEANWIWVADDDAYPEKDALEKINEYLEKNKGKNIAAVCGAIINNGKIDISHRKRIKRGIFKIDQIPVEEKEYKNESFNLDLFSYVGTVINKEKLEKVGLTEKDYFIYYDDTEHSYRLSKVGEIICISNAKINHDVDFRKTSEVDWKGYYSIRNRMLFIKKHFSAKYYFNMYNELYFKTLIKDFMKKKIISNKQIRTALLDSKNDKKGMHPIYKPGWKVD